MSGSESVRGPILGRYPELLGGLGRLGAVAVIVTSGFLGSLILSGCGGDDDSPGGPTTPPPRSVDIIAPVENSTVFGIIEIRSLTVSPEVSYYIDGGLIGDAGPIVVGRDNMIFTVE